MATDPLHDHREASAPLRQAMNDLAERLALGQASPDDLFTASDLIRVLAAVVLGRPVHLAFGRPAAFLILSWPVAWPSG